MAAVLPFDNGTIGGVAFATSAMVHGSGSLVLAGVDIQTTTADGRIRNVRQSQRPSTSFELFGDLVSTYKTAVGQAKAIVLNRAATPLEDGSFNGVCTAVYDESTHLTRIDIAADSTWT
ncbi:MAG: hypothetical protein GY851_35745 [bacterium]|nr:hypothetical protein [bacterium]